MSKSRPKIGLALGGGGARGLAHIGVINVLQKEGIPIHFLAGTSMGAVIAGIAAVGVKLDNAERILEGIDWRKLINTDVASLENGAGRGVIRSLKSFFEIEYYLAEVLFREGLEEGRNLGLTTLHHNLSDTGIAPPRDPSAQRGSEDGEGDPIRAKKAV